MPALWGQWVFHLVRADIDESLQRAEAMVTIADRDVPESVCEAYAALGIALLFKGNLRQALEARQTSLDAHLQMTHYPKSLPAHLDPKVICLSISARAAYEMGHFADAMKFGKDALAYGQDRGMPYSVAFSQVWLAYLYYFFGEVDDALAIGNKALSSGEKHGLNQVVAWASICIYRVNGNNDTNRGRCIQGLGTKLKALEDLEGLICCPQFIGMLSELMLLDGQTELALQEILRAISMSNKTGSHFYDAELLRLKAHAIFLKGKQNQAQQVEVNNILGHAWAICEGQGALTQQLRVASTLVAINAGTNLEKESRDALSHVLESLSQYDCADINLANSILGATPGKAEASSGWLKKLLLRK